MTAPQAKPDFPVGIYGITAEKFSNGRTNVEVVRQMLAGGIRIIQYREKRPYKSFAEMLAECRAIRALTRAAGALFIVNDYPSLALLADADGVHVGQDDLPVAEVRRLVGPHRLIGLSTHDPDQAAALQPYFDFSVAEECAAYGECNSYTAFTKNNKAVLHVEYEGSLSSFCATTKPLGFSSMLKKLDLDAWRSPCP